MISTFLWRKWQSIHNVVRQNLRTSAIFAITVSRAILTAYDVKLSKADAIDGNITSGNMTSQSCHYRDNWLWSPTEGFNLDLKSRSDSFGFWFTAAQCLWLFFLILRCIILANFEIHNSNFRDCVCKFCQRNKSVYCKSVQTSFEDVLFLFLGIFVCIVGSPGLRVVTSIMAFWMLAEEAVQLKTQKTDYLKSKENLLDLGMLTLTLPVLFLPDM